MIKQDIGSAIADSWIRRAGSDTPPSTSADWDPGSAVTSAPGTAHQGWDPMEVWLRRIDQPRRRSRAEDRLQHGDVG